MRWGGIGRCCDANWSAWWPRLRSVLGDVDGDFTVSVGTAEASCRPTTVMIPLLETWRCTLIGSARLRRAWHLTSEYVYILLPNHGYLEVCRGVKFTIATNRLKCTQISTLHHFKYVF
jgi:hypothetical protein